MKKYYIVLIYSLLAIAAILVIFYAEVVFGWKQELINLIFLNIIIIIIRKPFVSLFSYFIKNRLFRAIFSIIINIIWGIFLFWLLFTISGELFIAILSYLIVAISLNFRRILNNMASGALLLSAEKFEIGDLIESNDIQGIVRKIDLNYTKIEEFDGVKIIIPNQNVYDSTLVKFTHSKFKIYEALSKEEFPKRKYYKRYIKMLNKMISAKVKTTTYVKKVEILGTINPDNLKSLLSGIFERYKEIFGLKPDYAVDTTTFGRLKIMLYVKSEKPGIILNYMDAFLRDIVFTLYQDEIYKDWKKYQKKLKNRSNLSGDET